MVRTKVVQLVSFRVLKSKSTCFLALYWAAYGGHIDVAKLLLSNQYIDLNIQNKLGDTPLIAASYKGHADVVDLLVAKGADVNVANNAGDTARKAANSAQGWTT